MKIEGTDKAKQAGQTRKKGSVSSGEGSFGSMISGGAKEASGASAAQSLARVDSLLSVQATESPTERAARKRMAHRADTILDELDKIRTGLLSGTLTVGHVIDVADIVAAHREKIMDPALTAILDEIDLRAQVEIAKMRKALDNRKI
ncbi:MAG: flagellar assembly protein FliX [Alphaproteobacteria bacterium CG_4_9_14_3_um_filter_47_13]|nr:MAG: flagellar assembly protein FliX [Alphaproteobacteria bacterium CG_4_9_14_3_um_filter_47_13]